MCNILFDKNWLVLNGFIGAFAAFQRGHSVNIIRTLSLKKNFEFYYVC